MAEIHVEVSGEGPVLLLAHGFAGSARNFRPQARALRGAWRVVLYDARGHARSAGLVGEAAGDCGMEPFAADLGSVLDRIGAERAVVGGLSMGAAVALHWALAHPQRVRGLVLASIPPGRGADSGVSASAIAFARAIETRGLDAAGAEYVWGAQSGLDPAAARLVRQGFLEHPPGALARILRELLAGLPSVAEQLSQLQAFRPPVLVVAGAEDAGSREPSRSLAAALPQAHAVLIPGAGHVVNLERPDAFNRALSAWLDALPE